MASLLPVRNESVDSWPRRAARAGRGRLRPGAGRRPRRGGGQVS